MNCKLLSLLSCFSVFFCFVLSACSKGVQIADAPYATLYFNNKTLDPVNVQVSVGDEALMPYLTTGAYLQKAEPLSADSNTVQVKMVQLPGTTLVNRSFALRVGDKKIHYFTVFQAKSGDVPVLVVPEDTATLPPAGYAKVKFASSGSTMPDNIKLKFYQLNNTTPLDSCVAPKYGFSNWATVLIQDYNIQYEVYDATTNALLLSKRNFPTTRQDFSLDFNIYSITKNNSGDLSISRLY